MVEGRRDQHWNAPTPQGTRAEDEAGRSCHILRTRQPTGPGGPAVPCGSRATPRTRPVRQGRAISLTPTWFPHATMMSSRSARARMTVLAAHGTPPDDDLLHPPPSGPMGRQPTPRTTALETENQAPMPRCPFPCARASPVAWCKGCVVPSDGVPRIAWSTLAFHMGTYGSFGRGTANSMEPARDPLERPGCRVRARAYSARAHHRCCVCPSPMARPAPAGAKPAEEKKR